MICSLTKRLISRREDTAKPLPAWGERHLRSCPKCREFEAFCVSLGAKAKAGLDLRTPADKARAARIVSAIKTETPRRTALMRFPRPVPAAALIGLLATIAAVSVWLGSPRRDPLPELSSLLDPGRITALRAEITSVDVPLKREKEALDDVLGATVKYLVSRLDPGFSE
jgi:hypothetical protein